MEWRHSGGNEVALDDKDKLAANDKHPIHPLENIGPISR